MWALWGLVGEGCPRSPKGQSLVAVLELESLGWESHLPPRFKKSTEKTEVLPFKYRKSPVAFMFPLTAV